MKTELQIDITYEQIVSLVKQLPMNEKVALSKELAKEGIASRLSALLATFQTDELSLETIDEEAKAVRQELYERQKQ